MSPYMCRYQGGKTDSQIQYYVLSLRQGQGRILSSPLTFWCIILSVLTIEIIFKTCRSFILVHFINKDRSVEYLIHLQSCGGVASFLDYPSVYFPKRVCHTSSKRKCKYEAMGCKLIFWLSRLQNMINHANMTKHSPGSPGIWSKLQYTQI